MLHTPRSIPPFKECLKIKGAGCPVRDNFFFSNFLGALGISRQNREIPPKKFGFPGFEGHTELFGPHRFTCKTPTSSVVGAHLSLGGVESSPDYSLTQSHDKGVRAGRPATKCQTPRPQEFAQGGAQESARQNRRASSFS